MRKKLVILGSTGSIGMQALKIIRNYPDLFDVVGLVAHRNEELLAEQVREFKPTFSALTSKETDGAVRVASETDCDLVLNAIVGIAGLAPTLAAISSGRDVALANKETLVAGGGIVMRAAQHAGVKILPVDSEHSAIWQATDFGYRMSEVKKLILTASGGAFRDIPAEKFGALTKKDALKHPTWTMGEKITVDCASMMNKGLEIIEAMHLFNIGVEHIDVVVHRESIIHSMVVMRDNSIIAEMSPPSMEIPIQLAMTYPEVFPTSVSEVDFCALKSMSFQAPDYNKFPCLLLAIECAKAGGIAPAIMNAANEVAVEMFLHGRIKFNEIACRIVTALDKFAGKKADSLEALLELDKMVRLFTSNV